VSSVGIGIDSTDEEGTSPSLCVIQQEYVDIAWEIIINVYDKNYKQNAATSIMLKIQDILNKGSHSFHEVF